MIKGAHIMDYESEFLLKVLCVSLFGWGVVFLFADSF